MAKKIAIGLLCLILIITLSVGLSGCRTVNKTVDNIHKKSDSTNVSSSSTQQNSTNDSSAEQTKGVYNNSITYADSNGTLDVTFYDYKDAYSDCGGDTTKGKRDTTKNREPVTIRNNQDGSLSINPGGRQIKNIKQTSSKKAVSSTESKTDTTTKTKVSTTNQFETKNRDSGRVVVDLNQYHQQKDTSSFNWLWLLVLIPIGFYSYYKFKK